MKTLPSVCLLLVAVAAVAFAVDRELVGTTEGEGELLHVYTLCQP